MQISYHKVKLAKRFPLAISRGVRSHSENLFLHLEKDGISAWGEAAPGSTEGASSVEEIQTALGFSIRARSFCSPGALI